MLAAGLTLAASGGSVGGAIGAVSDELGDSQPTDDEQASPDDEANGGEETENSDGETDETDSGDNGGSDSGSDDDGSDSGGDDGGSDSGSDDDGSDSGSDGETGGTQTLTATVEDDSGDPVEDATVEVDGHGVSETKTVGSNGEATFDLEDGEYTVTASADGYQSAESTVTIDGDDETVTLTLEEDGGGDELQTLTTIVEDDSGDPVEDATVEVSDDSGFFPSSEEQTVDSNGEAEFELEDGEYTVTVTADGYESTEATVTIDGDDETITLSLEEDG